MTRRRRPDRGAAAVELLLMVPVLMSLVVLVVTAGKVVQSKGDASDAAYSAARAASLASSWTEAQRSAESSALDWTSTHEGGCERIDISLAGSDFTAGGQITVTASCHAVLLDAGGVASASERTFVATATVPIDQHRELT